MTAAIAQILRPRERSIDGFSVRRALPYGGGRMVGPFIFFDHIGPTRLREGGGLDVRPHPHIGLATVTYLFEGEIVHRDSLGFVQPIRPGDVNWMTAGSGIVHSERSGAEERAKGAMLHGLQSWVALPRAHEETAPAFRHHPGASLPEIAVPGGRLRVIAGGFDGTRSPVETLSDMFYLDATLEAGAELRLPAGLGERAVYVVEGGVSAAGLLKGGVSAAGTEVAPAEMAILAPGADALVTARAASRLVALGGAPLDGPRHIWWNFVSSSRERISAAADAWKAGGFASVPGDPEFIPLPENREWPTERR